MMPWCIGVLHGVCSVALKPVALRPVFGDALVHLRAVLWVQSGPVLSVALRLVLSDALVNLRTASCVQSCPMVSVALRPVFGDALVHLRTALWVQSGPVVSVALRPMFSDALVHLRGTACAVGLQGQSGSNATDAQVHLCMARRVQCGSEAL